MELMLTIKMTMSVCILHLANSAAIHMPAQVTISFEFGVAQHCDESQQCLASHDVICIAEGLQTQPSQHSLISGVCYRVQHLRRLQGPSRQESTQGYI